MNHVAFEIRNDIGLLRLARPEKLNALTPGMLSDIATTVTQIEANPALRALVVHADGKAFSVGADIDIWSELSPEAFRLRWMAAGHRAFDALACCRIPVIAAIHGYAFGGGLELALAADMRIAEEGAVLALPEVSLGTVPGWGGTQRLTELVGRSRAKQMVLAARRIDARRAESWGLVNETWGSGEALEAALALAGEIASRAPVAVQIAKQLIDASTGESLALTLETLAGMATLNTADLSEGIAAFREKRAPVFGGA